MNASEKAADDFADLIQPPSETGVRFSRSRDRWAWESARKSFLDGVELWQRGGTLEGVYRGNTGQLATCMASGFKWAADTLPPSERTAQDAPEMSPEQRQREREFWESGIRDAEDRA